MKKNLLFVLGLVAMLVMVAGCGDDDVDDTPFGEQLCVKAYECKDTVIESVDEALFTAMFQADEATCIDTWTAVADTTDDTTEEEATEEETTEEVANPYEACLAKDCAEFAACMNLVAGDDDDDTTDDDDDDDDTGCTSDDECDTWAACLDDGTGVMACELSCGEAWVEGTHGNNDCVGTYDMVTALYGDCAPVACVEDADCAGLGACDTTPSEAAFICDTAEGSCKRQ
jgi:hypothetical protein